MALSKQTKKLLKQRRDYLFGILTRKNLSLDPIDQFTNWLNEAISENVDLADAMSLSTCSHNQPDSRMVVLRGLSSKGFVFHTNYMSKKGRDLKNFRTRFR